MGNLTSGDLAGRIRNEILEDRTKDDPAAYGANYVTVEDSGTAHLAFLGPDGDAVSVTSTINYYFGSGKLYKLTYSI